MSLRSKSQSSFESIGLGSPTCLSPNFDEINLPKPLEFSISKLDPEGASPNFEYLYSSIVLLIYCEKHGKVALSYHKRSEAAWLPFIAAPVNKTWVDATQDFVKSIFSKEESEGADVCPTTAQIEIKSMHTVHILRVQLPVTQKFIYRLMQLIKLIDINEKNCVCSQSSNRLKWVNLAEAKSGNVINLWGPEVALFSQSIPDLKQQEIYEFGLEQAYIYVSPNGVRQNEENKLLLSTGVGQAEVEKVYQDFLEFCFPAFYMTFTAFHKYICMYLPLKDDEETSLRLFSSFNFAFNGYLSFHEFLLGLVVMEPKCLHNEFRLKFIFRYYDEDQDQELNELEMTKLAKNLELNDISLFREQMDSPNLQYSTFLKLEQQRQILNTEYLFRVSIAVIPRICKNVQNRQERRLVATKRTDTNLQQTNINQNLCLACRTKKFLFGTHCVRLDPSGRCIEPRRLSDYDTVGEAENSQEIGMAKYSLDYVFDTNSIGHTFIDMLREFNVSKGTTDKPNGFLATPKYRRTFLQYLKVLCQNVISLFECEDRLIKINSPAYVIGDICGNLQDLLVIGQIIWKEVPVVANNYVFLGNYVNEGKWGIECLLYIFALKLIEPNKFFFLRGTHEIREAQNDHNGLHKECLDKYGDHFGEEVYNAVNEVFDRLCLACLIDDSVLCTNNTVPIHASSLESVCNISSNLKDPMNDSVAKQMFDKRCSDEHTVQFLEQNELSHLIQSNQSLPEGYHISGGRKIISTSIQQCSKNELTILCVDRPKIRIIKLDTSK